MYKMAKKCSSGYKVGDVRRNLIQNDQIQKHFSQFYHYKPLITNQKSHF